MHGFVRSNFGMETTMKALRASGAALRETGIGVCDQIRSVCSVSPRWDWRGGMRKIRTISDFICTRSVLYLRVHRTKSVLYRRVHRAYIGLNPYYIAAYIRTISDFLAFLKPLSNCNTNALCLNHVQTWSLICIRGCASPMSVVEENTLQVTPSRAVHVV